VFVDSLIAYVENGEEDLYRASSDARPCWASWLLYDKAVIGSAIEHSLSAFYKRKSASLQKVFVLIYFSGRAFCFIMRDWTNMLLC